MRLILLLLILCLTISNRLVAQIEVDSLILNTWGACGTIQEASTLDSITFNSTNLECNNHISFHWTLSKDSSITYLTSGKYDGHFYSDGTKWKVENSILIIGDNKFRIQLLTSSILTIKRIQ